MQHIVWGASKFNEATAEIVSQVRVFLFTPHTPPKKRNLDLKLTIDKMNVI